MKRSTQDIIKRNSKPGEAGFTLIETCIVIIIMSIVLMPLFAYMTMQRNQEAMRKEQLRSDRIITALAIYVKRNGFYPCPADPTLPQTNNNFGNGSRTPVVGGVCNAGNLIPAGGGVIIGDLPVRDLNLPFRMAANNDGWKYRYAITQNLTQTATYGAGVGNVVVNGLAQPAHFVVVNLGRDGKGARNLEGVVSPILCVTALDRENCNNDNIFLESAKNTGTNVNGANYYDDDLAYTLINKDSTMWVMRESAATSGALNISNRNIGNVGIGTPTPSARLHVQGGDVRVEAAAGVGGNVNAQVDITAQQNISARQSVTAQQKMTAPVFYYDTVVPPP